MSTTSLHNAMLDVYVAPSSLFESLKQSKGPTLIPLLIIIAVSFGAIMYFYSGMSTEWIVEQQMLQVPDASPAEEEQMRAYLTQSAGGVAWIGGIFNTIATLLIVALLAGYFRLVGGSNEELTYSEWFKFSVWTQMPTIVYMIGFMALVLSASTADLPLMLINYASVNQLFLDLPVGHQFYTFAESLNLFFIWNVVLSTIGLKHWANMSTIKAVIFSSLPYVVIFSIWAALA